MMNHNPSQENKRASKGPTNEHARKGSKASLRKAFLTQVMIESREEALI